MQCSRGRVASGAHQGQLSKSKQLAAVNRRQQYLEDLKAFWDSGTQCAVLRKADEVKVERVGQVAL